MFKNKVLFFWHISVKEEEAQSSVEEQLDNTAAIELLQNRYGRNLLFLFGSNSVRNYSLYLAGKHKSPMTSLLFNYWPSRDEVLPVFVNWLVYH